MKPKKKKFEVQEGESIHDCLERMNKEGYTPIRRMEEPVFQEVKKEGQVSIEPCGRKIVFDGVLKN